MVPVSYGNPLSQKRREVDAMVASIVKLIYDVMVGVAAYYIGKWLDSINR